MVKALSLELRIRVLQAVAEGASHRAVAERFGVTAASAAAKATDVLAGLQAVVSQGVVQ